MGLHGKIIQGPRDLDVERQKVHAHTAVDSTEVNFDLDLVEADAADPSDVEAVLKDLLIKQRDPYPIIQLEKIEVEFDFGGADAAGPVAEKVFDRLQQWRADNGFQSESSVTEKVVTILKSCKYLC